MRDFLTLCHQLDLPAVLRLGPWGHGEVLNGGFPDWVQHADFWPGQGPWKNRDTHPEFMRLTTILHRQIAVQLQGLLWKDDGSVIGVQHDNECSVHGADYWQNDFDPVAQRWSRTYHLPTSHGATHTIRIAHGSN